MSAPTHGLDSTGTDTSAAPGRTRWLGLGVLAAGLSMIVLDGTIVGVALPRIILDLHLDITDAQWVNSLYAIVFAALLLSFGRLGDRIGRRRVFATGVIIFTGGSVVAALSASAGTLIAARAIQGIGGAMVLPASLSTVNATFRGRDRAVAFGVWGAVMAGMAAIGPLLGGALTTALSWPWIFWVNVPIGALVLAGTAWFVRDSKGGTPGPGADVDGLLTSALGFGLVTFALIEGHQLGWWKPIDALHLFGITWPMTAPISAVPVALALGLVFIALFVLWERHRGRNGRSAILDLSIFGVRTFSWGNLTAAMVAVGEFALIFVLPLYLVNVLGLSIMGAGLVLAAMAAGALISGAQARHLAARLGPPRVVLLGLALEIGGALATGWVLGPSTAPILIALLMAVYGIGLGLASAQLTSTVLADVPAEQSGAASATQSTVRQLGSALGSALAGTVLALTLNRTLTARLSEVLPGQAGQALAEATTSSAGANLIGLRALGSGGPLGQMSPQVLQSLETGFASAAASVVYLAVAFMALGLVGAWRVAAVAGKPAAAEQCHSPR